jgi:hypothetical protein
MGIAILVIFSIGLYQAGKWVVFKALPKRDDVVSTTDFSVTAAAQQVQPEAVTTVEQSWAGYEAPTFVRRGLPFPVLMEKVKKKRVRKSKLKAVPAPEEDLFPMGDWTLFANHEGDHHVTTH